MEEIGDEDILYSVYDMTDFENNKIRYEELSITRLEKIINIFYKYIREDLIIFNILKVIMNFDNIVSEENNNLYDFMKPYIKCYDFKYKLNGEDIFDILIKYNRFVPEFINISKYYDDWSKEHIRNKVLTDFNI